MNVYKKFRETAEEHQKRPAVFWKEKKHWKHYNYEKFLQVVDNVAEGLFLFGLRKGDRVAILSENRPEWLVSDLAINKLGAVSVPIHFTSNKSLIEYILKDSGSGFFVISENLFKKHYLDFKEKNELKDFKKIIIIGDYENDNFKNIINFKELVVPKDSFDNKNKSDENDLASIIYTSGTTGQAKGVKLSNYNFLSNVKEVCGVIKINYNDKFLSFLPMSHVLERTAGNYVPILCGASIAYAENVKKLVDNLKEINPTILIAVPKIFERVYEKIFSTFKSKNKIIRKFFFWSLKPKKKFFKKFIAEKIIYKNIRKAFGSNLRFAVSGGASIHENILKFFKNMGVEIIEGYGLTETSPIIAVNNLEDGKIGSVGKVLPKVEIKIAKDKEILVKGSNVMSGYWNNEELTKEVFDEDGWFCTGDLGYLDGDNFLTIIGRKKEILVTSNGKNIAPEKIEGLINLSPYIEQSLVVGHRRKFLVALIVPDFKSIKEKLNISNEEMISSSYHGLKRIINNEIERINKNLEYYEKIRRFKVLNESFSMECDELTPTLKVRREIIKAKRKKEIEEMYDV